MGLTYSDAIMLVEAKRNNCCFDNMLTIGRQTSYLTKKEIEKLAARAGIDPLKAAFCAGQQYADKFFEIFLGAKSVKSVDYSDYEHCAVVHDMNTPIGREYYEQFDAVLDIGTIEHVFNFPIAIANCMNMVKNGGNIFIFTTANQHMGHGFYQFSPELFFRIFQPPNGFKISDVILVEHPFPGKELSPKAGAYRVTDPFVVRRRVGLVSKFPVEVMVSAKRIDIKPIFSNYPIQSDYAAVYDASQKDSRQARESSFLRLIAKKIVFALPYNLRNYILGKSLLRDYSFRNKNFYKKIKL